MLRHLEVQHPAGVGTHLVIARIDRVLQGKVAIAIAIGRDDYVLSLYYHAVGRYQLDIEYAAHIGKGQVVGAHHISLIPDGVAFKIALVVQMQIDLLLHGGLLQHVLHGLESCLTLGGEAAKQQREKIQYPFHFISIKSLFFQQTW